MRILFTYVVLLVAFDAVASVAIGYLTNSYAITMTAFGVRAVIVAVFTPVMISSVHYVLGWEGAVNALVSTIVLYVVLPLFVFLLIESSGGLWSMYVQLHSNRVLFAIALLPYVLASTVSIGIVSRYDLLRL